MPGEIELVEHLRVDLLKSELRQNALEHAPMDDVELDEGNLAGAQLVHARLILRAPGVREGKPVERVSQGAQDRARLARNTIAPIDHGAEDVEHERLHAVAERRALGMRS